MGSGNIFSQRRWQISLLLLVVVSATLMLYGLDGTPFRGRYDDVDRSLIARNMVDSGEWLVPHYLFKDIYTKPPLMYWTAGALGLLTGRSDELPGNLASVLGMLLVVICTFWAGRTMFGTRSGLRAGLLLVTMYLFLAMSRQALLDTVMMAGFGLSFASLISLAYTKPTRPTGTWLLFTLGLAISFMTKGPVIVPVILLMAIPLIRRKKLTRPSGKTGWLMAALMLAILLPWPILLLKSSPEAVATWKFEFFGRFGGGDNFLAFTQKPFWFYTLDIVNTMPWLLLLIGGFVHCWKERKQTSHLMLLWWALGGLIFFSVSSSTKRSYYLLPLYPGFALVCSVYWDDLVRRAEQALPRGKWRTFTSLGTIVLVLVAGTVFGSLPIFFPNMPQTPVILPGVLTVIAGGFALYFHQKGNLSTALNSAIAGAAFLFLGVFGSVIPLVNTHTTCKPFFAEAAPMMGDETVLLYKVPAALTVFYLHQQPWTYTKDKSFAAAANDSTGALVITRPSVAAQWEGLTPLLEREFTEPFGKTKGLGLYRTPQK